jgi:glutamyl-Q tRNA(Asp) synthetase
MTTPATQPAPPPAPHAGSVATDINNRRPGYTGRFAPSPTGPLHFGSLISALASWLDARARNGRWLVRIEDIDPLREEPGATRDILDCLRAHGLYWDGDVVYQSERLAIYRNAALQLIDEHRAFFCTCSRSQLAGHSVYPGYCRNCFSPPAQMHAIRLRVPELIIEFNDGVQGHYSEWLDRAVGDFVIYRKEQLPAYQLAVVIDDSAQDVTHVVRGCDLLDNTARQIWLQQCLQLPTPAYAHVPVIANPLSQKLSKQTHARALDPAQAIDNLCAALEFLGQPLPDPARRVSVDSLLSSAVANWSLTRVPRARALSGAALPASCRGFSS